jgi:hypothetical protein
MAELFDRYAVDRVPRWPLLSRLVALSVVLHGLFFVAVIYVPSLRNLLRVAGSMSGIELVSEDYDRTLLGQRATIIKLEPYEKLYYPVDYFGAPPDPAVDPMLMTQVAPPPPPPVVIRPPRQPRQRAQAVPTPSPEPSPAVAEITPTPTPDDAQGKAAEAEIDKVAQQYGVKRPQPNTKPFEELAQKGKELFDQGKLNANTTLDVTATAERNPDGTFNPDSVDLDLSKVQDPVLQDLSRQLLTALSQSRVLGVLDDVKQVSMKLTLDQQVVSVRIANEFPSETLAGEKAEGYALLVAAARLTKSGTDEGQLYNNLKITRDGKQLVMTFEMPKDAAGKMIAEMLARKAAKDAKEKEAAGATPANGKS